MIDIRQILAQRRARQVLGATMEGFRRRHDFDGVGAYCFFVGHGRNGSTLLGALLDAHPDMVIAHEADAFGLLDLGISRRQLYGLLLARDRYFVEELDVTWEGYSYEVPGQMQGRYRSIKVIGDKKARRATVQLGEDPLRLEHLRRLTDVPIRILNTIRNPYDNLTTIGRRAERDGRGQPWATWVREYFERCATIQCLREELAPEEILDVRNEDVIADPVAQLARICAFLGVDLIDDWADACAAIVFPTPHQTRGEIGWTDDLLDEIRDGIERYDFLAGYEFEPKQD